MPSLLSPVTLASLPSDSRRTSPALGCRELEPASEEAEGEAASEEAAVATSEGAAAKTRITQGRPGSSRWKAPDVVAWPVQVKTTSSRHGSYVLFVGSESSLSASEASDKPNLCIFKYKTWQSSPERGRSRVGRGTRRAREACQMMFDKGHELRNFANSSALVTSTEPRASHLRAAISTELKVGVKKSSMAFETDLEGNFPRQQRMYIL
mmetsp:Transcript_54599/g.119521  ORF Transcript_54599/g.119521 Transcript_54599/m.119521 type:complete len:209 (+) Transcript_54599:933-1559(+)